MGYGVFCRALLICCACASSVFAQERTPNDPVEDARIQFGPLGLTPSIALTNLGVDTNVFNELVTPRSDFTATGSPRLDAWFRAGRSRTRITGGLDFVYFRKFESERSIDSAVAARFELPGNRLVPWVAGAYTTGRQRVGYEIDLRSRRVTRDWSVGVDTRLTAKTRLVFRGASTDYRYDADATFFGSGLEETLNRRTESVGVDYRQSLTVLTTLVLSVSAGRDRFEFSQDRNSDSLRVETGFDLGDRALISGQVRLGYRKFDGLRTVPDYRGLVASFVSGMTLMGRTRVAVEGERDIEYSVDFEQPYYVITGGLLTITPRLTRTWDVQGRAGAQRLAYRPSEGVQAVLNGRVDNYVRFGGGVGYTLGDDTRIGLNFDRERRSSPADTRDYTGFRFGTSVTYGR